MACFLSTPHCFIFLFVVVAVLCSTLCVAGDGASGSGDESGKVSAKIFESIKDNLQGPTNGASATPKPITICQIKLPFLLFAAKDNVMVAVTEVEYIDAHDGDDCKGGKKKFGVVAKYFEAKDNIKWDKDNFETTIEKWNKQLATDNGQAKTFSTVMASAVNAEKNKIYVFLLDSTSTGGSGEWKVKLLCGTISDAGGSKKIDWKTEEIFEPKLVEKVKQKLNKQTSTLSLVDGSAFFMKSGKFFLVVKGKSKESTRTNTEQNFIAYFQYEEKANKLEFLNAESTAGWYPSFFEWNGEIYKTPTNSGNDKVMVFNASQSNNFTERDSSITRLGDFLKDKKNFATSKIGVKGSALLFTEERENKEKKSEGKNDAHLWMSDGTRVGYVGPIITGFKKISYGPVLHANNSLFVLHQNYNIQNGNAQQKDEFNITLLDGELGKIKDIITTWENNDKKIEGLCKDAFTTTPPCLTDGPVGFLSGNNSGEEWKNEYLNVNAKLSNKKSGVVQKNVQNGFKFSGSGAGAQWPADEQWQNQPYNFKNPGFTLVATVTIDGSGTKGADNSVLGVGLTEENKVGLWCSTDGKWQVRNGQTKAQSQEINCTRDERYYVALVLNGSEKVSVYVDGRQLTELNGDKIKIDSSKNIEYFYFGADKNTEPETNTNVTIENVLLYNRPFTTEEVEQIKPKQNDEADGQQKREDGELPIRDKNTTETETESPSNTSATEKDEAEDKQSSPPPSTEDSAARVGVVGVLCFMLFGVFTLLGRYV